MTYTKPDITRTCEVITTFSKIFRDLCIDTAIVLGIVSTATSN